MTVFFLSAAALLLLALLLLMPAMLRCPPAPAAARKAAGANVAVLREQLAQLNAEFAAGSLNTEQHRRARAEIERRVLDEEGGAQTAAVVAPARKTALLVAALLPSLALGLYFALGNLQGLAPSAAAPADAAGEVTLAQVEEIVIKLAQRIENDPAAAGDVKGWTMLGRTYAAIQRFPEASKAFARAIALTPDDAQLLADQAYVLTMVQGEKTDGEPARLIERALRLDPNNPKALTLAGSAAFERKDYATAIERWSAARHSAPPDSEFVKELEAGIADARAAMAGTAPVMAAASNEGGASASTSTSTSARAGLVAGAPSARIAGRVSVAPALAARVLPTDTVFIFAHAVEGPRMPLAILRRSAAELPIAFTLDDTQAMSPEMKLSRFPAVILGARISRSGNATPNAGDLTGRSPTVKVGSESVQLVIDSIQP